MLVTLCCLALQVAGIKITTCHNFDVHAPFRWQCTNYRCAHRGAALFWQANPPLADRNNENKLCAQTKPAVP